MAETKLEDLSIKDLTAHLAAINLERDEIVRLIQEAASAIGLPGAKAAPALAAPAPPRPAPIPQSYSTTADMFQAALAGGKVFSSTGELLNAVVALGCKKGTAQPFPYSKLGKKLLARDAAGWRLRK
jgi:hypothetical protein